MPKKKVVLVASVRGTPGEKRTIERAAAEAHQSLAGYLLASGLARATQEQDRKHAKES